MAKRFIFAVITFIGLVFPAVFGFALLAAPAQPAPLEHTVCDQTLADAFTRMSAQQERVKRLGAARGPEACAATRLYFLEVVKARAVTAQCKSGPERERELGRLDADAETINNTIAARCS